MNIRAAENNFTNRCKVIVVDYWAAKQKNRDGRGSFAQFGFAPQFAPNFHRSCLSTQQFIGSSLSEYPKLSTMKYVFIYLVISISQCLL